MLLTALVVNLLTVLISWHFVTAVGNRLKSFFDHKFGNNLGR
jgi:hypothetical protein